LALAQRNHERLARVCACSGFPPAKAVFFAEQVVTE
jgi:hypothetical protein